MALITAVVGMVAGVVPQASAASLPTFPMALPVQWGATVQAGGTHTFASGTLSSIDLGATNNVSVAVVAAADGVVGVGGANGFSRCFVTITHTDGWQTMYYHLKGIPSGLSNGDRVVAGQKLGMTGKPGSETCGRGSFRHVHFTLLRNGVEQPMSGLSLGGYTIQAGSRAYCGLWTRDSDGAVVADARRACLAVPKLVNNIVNPSTLADRGAAVAVANRDSERPVIAGADTISAAKLYVTDGEHVVNGRAWKTKCEPYSQTSRCRTDIWATQVTPNSGGFDLKEGWAFNNLTYVEAPRTLWDGNPLGNSTDGWTADDGRKWRTECDTESTGRNGCRSYVWIKTTTATARASGGYTFTGKDEWVFNNMVRFSA